MNERLVFSIKHAETFDKQKEICYDTMTGKQWISRWEKYHAILKTFFLTKNIPHNEWNSWNHRFIICFFNFFLLTKINFHLFEERIKLNLTTCNHFMGYVCAFFDWKIIGNHKCIETKWNGSNWMTIQQIHLIRWNVWCSFN